MLKEIILATALASPLLWNSICAADLNVADPDKHPYADRAGGREGHPLAGETVNEARLYDFYQRQADFYMASPELPQILPAFPGLGAGLHGHWGKHNQNQHEDGRWNDAIRGPAKAGVLRTSEFVVGKAVTVDLRQNVDDPPLTVCFDPLALTYRVLWKGGVFYQPYRWGTSRNMNLNGEPVFSLAQTDGWGEDTDDAAYRGYYANGKRVVFSYEVGGVAVLDSPMAVEGGFVRVLEFPHGVGREIRTRVFAPQKSASRGEVVGDALVYRVENSEESLVVSSAGATLEVGPEGGVWLKIPAKEKPSSCRVFVVKSAKPDELQPVASTGSLSELTKGGGALWPETFTLPGKLGNDGEAYAIDTLPLPTKNPWNAAMQLSGIDFQPNGDALVTTLQGDVWRVSGLDEKLDAVRWKRFATGLHQPLGMHIDEDGIFVLGRDQITRLHDLDGDGEADFFENYANDFGNFFKSHSHTFGLGRTSDGAFHFVARDRIMRTSGGPNRITEEIASGVRNCMGFGASRDGSDIVLIAPQEGSWTPGSMIIEVSEGEFYGHLFNRTDRPEFAAPLCFVPRGIDNSTGGMVHVPPANDRWGPFGGSFVGLSYGACSHFMILRDAESGARPQGAIVPLSGDFEAGVMRGAFSPKDGQLYAVGLDGWGDYSIADGCLHRVRYTGKPVLHPTGFGVHANGLRIDFAEKLDARAVENTGSYFAQQWNYEYARRYGSPEFSVRHPESLGHDPVAVRSAKLLPGGKSIFLEIPEIEPVMQFHVRMHLATADGKPFKTDLFPSLIELGKPFEAPGLAPSKPDKPTKITLRIREGDAAIMPTLTESGATVPGEREIRVNAIAGLQFDKKELTATAGEALAIRLSNKDAMPHNLVVVRPGAMAKIGELSMKMLTDPTAGDKHYVPDEPEVLAFTHVIGPDSTHTVHFRLPDEPGDYPFLCTFPGHWMTMNGIIKVKPKTVSGTPQLFDRKKLFGWSMMAFDAAERGPRERCEAVVRLGLGGYGVVPYTYRFDRIFTPEEMDAELRAAKRAGLEVRTVWADHLNPQDPLGTDPEKHQLTGLVVDALLRTKTRADVWFWMRDSEMEQFDALNDEQRATRIAAAADRIAARIEPLGGRVGLYNHGGWLGKIENQLRVLDAMKQKNAGIALNLHHGGPDPARVAGILEQAGGRVIGLVLNGHDAEGKPRGIQPFGTHDADLGTLRAILDAGYEGPVGILDHHFESDMESRLGQSLEGLERLLEKLPAAKAAERRPGEKPRSPNILFIMADDMGYADASCYGSKVLQTPNLDRMAAEGMRFTDAYSGCTVCAPARSTLMTGLHMGQTPVRGNSGGIPLADGDLTVAEILKEAGYVTGGFGKWGLGDIETEGAAEKQGFDQFFGYYHQIHAHSYYPEYLIKNGERYPLKANAGLADSKPKGPTVAPARSFTAHLIFEEMKKFLRENRDRPFFCYAPWTPPHSPYHLPEDEPAWELYKDKDWPTNAKVHAAFVTMNDRMLGETLALLDELGLTDNTIVFFCSDNGGSQRFDGSLDSCAPFAGRKTTMNEGGLRVPLVVKWPGHIKAGTVSHLPTCFPDFLPTAAHLAGAEVPEHVTGISILPTLLGKAEEQEPRDTLYWEYPKFNFRERVYYATSQAVRRGKWKLLREEMTDPWQVYDLEEDIGETRDLAAEQAPLIAEIEAWIRENRTDPHDQSEPPVPEGKRFR